MRLVACKLYDCYNKCINYNIITMIYYHIMLQVWQPLLPDDLRMRSFLHNAVDSPPLTRTTLGVSRSLRKHLIRKRKANEAKSFRAAVAVSENAQRIIFIRIVTLYVFIYLLLLLLYTFVAFVMDIVDRKTLSPVGLYYI